MRKLIVAVAVTAGVALAGVAGWHARAAAPAGAVPQAGAYTPIHPAACGGRGRCAWGWHYVCGPYRCWCARC
ncbi:MAG TPA: hypothetical protein VMB84_18765 [Stellaceae bacterium]|nr:hypothetical protein [Stellaceae bacterium]